MGGGGGKRGSGVPPLFLVEPSPPLLCPLPQLLLVFFISLKNCTPHPIECHCLVTIEKVSESESVIVCNLTKSVHNALSYISRTKSRIKHSSPLSYNSMHGHIFLICGHMEKQSGVLTIPAVLYIYRGKHSTYKYTKHHCIVRTTR